MRRHGLRRWLVAAGAVVLTPVFLAGAQTTDRPEAHAERVPDGTIRIDGTLDEAVWSTAPAVTDFIQAEPDEGAPPTDRMEVRFAYDDSALYVGARMFSTAPVQAPLSRRDDSGLAESLQIELDTYLDRRTAYMFGVTAAGVRLDHYHPRDDEGNRDLEYDPVWQARTVGTDEGWTAELWLPFSQLRFNARAEQVFGLNITRDLPALNEADVWSLVRRTESGWASRFGDLRGIEGIEPRLRLELLPYISGSSQVTGERDPNDPFDDGKNLGARGGADVKYGVSSNLTLDVAFNPDFGQIEADPAEVNLTVFETIFSERRPFFLEGNDVLTAGTGNYYYSRRIGATPTGAAEGDYVDRPDTATILAAAKLTGRLSSGTALGFLAAVTDGESAQTSIDGVLGRTRVAPRSGWAVARVIQDVGDQGSTVGGHVTVVHRGMAADDPLAAVLSRNAVTAGADTRIRFADQGYEAAFNVGFTHIDGEPDAVTGFQRRNTHLFQRVDLPVPLLDVTRRALDGGQVTGGINKLSGRHWLWNASVMIESPEFEPSDFGRLNFAGDYTWRANLEYRETVPGRFLRAYSVGPDILHYSYYDRTLGNRYNLGVNASATFLNFWSTRVSLTRYLRGFDAQLTRGGPVMGVPLGWGASWSLRNRAGSQTQWSGQANYQSNEIGDYTWGIGASWSTRPSPSLELSVRPDYSDERGTRGTFSGPINRQFLTTLPGGRAETFGNRYVFGFPDRTTLSTQFRASYTFKPDLTLEVYAEPFAASGRYLAFGETLLPGARDLRVYGQNGTRIERLEDGSYQVTDGADTFALANRDFTIRSFRSTVVLRWEWRPGSTLFVVWQQNRESRDSQGAHVGFGDLFESLTASGDNIFAVKTTVWTSQ
ncbi:MAG: DUF5916 domain-containing protein [Acidobacteria bacterium]|nr:DUF5916 domain-containing protein [Acidobacteriota bacterium]